MHLPWADGQTDRSSGRCQGICDGDNVIMWILKFVALVMPVLSRRAPHLVAFPAGAMDNDTCCPDLQLYAKNTVWRFLSGMRLASVMFKASWHVLSGFTKYWFRLPMLDALHGWNAPWSEKLSSLHPGRASLSRELNCSVNLARDTSTFKRGRLSWAFVRNAMGWGWGMALFEWRWLSRTVRACCWGRVAILIHVLSK